MREASLTLLLSTAAAAVLTVACGTNDPAPPRVGPGGGSDAGGASGDYPAGPYGVSNGDVVQDHTWDGWTEPKESNYDEDALAPISLKDYYDPDGTKGYKAIVVNAAARWCSVCKIEQKDIRAMRDEWGPKGVVFIEALFEDVSSQPAKPSDLVAWGSTYQIDWVLVLDPANKLSAYFDPSSAPMNMIINARTMEIRDIVTGLPDESWWSNHLGPLTAQ